MSTRWSDSRHVHSHLILILLSILVGVVITMAWYRPASTRANVEVPTALAAIEGAFTSIAENARPAVVNIEAERAAPRRAADLEEMLRRWERLFPWEPPEGDERRTPRMPIPSLGTGFIIRPEGYILTNNHVVEEARNIWVQLFDARGIGRRYRAEVVGTDKKTELAVIKIEAQDLPTLSLGDSDATKIGALTMAIGSPFRQGWTVTLGVLSAKHRTIPGETDYLRVGDLLQTDAAINPGNSGGPLLNMRGEVIGINVAIQSASPVPRSAGIGFAIPSNKAREVVPQLIEHGRVARGYLGIRYREPTPEDREFFGEQTGVLVVDVEDGSPAAKAGIAPEDILIRFAGREIRRTEDLENIVISTPPGDTVDAVVVRTKIDEQGNLSKTEKNLRVTLGEPPAEHLGGRTAERSEPEEAATDTTALGIGVRALATEQAEALGIAGEGAVVVVEVEDDSPARGRLTSGDLIFKVNGAAVKGAADFRAKMERAAQGHHVVFSVGHVLAGELSRDVVTVRLRK
ncbi:MAG: trypsin-like peptidase domain-containing protein [Armatimonadota bacterium]